MKNLKSGINFVTGGAGFIGSHIVDKLVNEDLEVRVLDNLSNGDLVNLKKSKDKKNFQFEKNDLANFETVQQSLKDVKTVFHMAANPEVRIGFKNPEISYRENIQNTFHLLEAIRRSDVETIVFASTSTVYGEPEIIPTPETYGPLIPISIYGASKLACEAMISSYCHTYGVNGLILRFTNIVGSRSNHGVIIDFIKKLQNDNKNLEVLGDGKQSKSYLHVSECVESFFFCLSKLNQRIEIFNIGNDDQTDVLSIANIVTKCMGLDNVKIKPTGGVDGGRGWKGDVKFMNLDISKLKKLGWAPQHSSNASVELSTKELLQENI